MNGTGCPHCPHGGCSAKLMQYRPNHESSNSQILPENKFILKSICKLKNTVPRKYPLMAETTVHIPNPLCQSTHRFGRLDRTTDFQ